MGWTIHSNKWNGQREPIGHFIRKTDYDKKKK